MNGLWVRSQYGDLIFAQEFVIEASESGVAYIFANCKAIAVYKTEKRAMEVMDDIELQLIKGSSYDDMYGSRRVSKQNIYHMPKE